LANKSLFVGTRAAYSRSPWGQALSFDLYLVPALLGNIGGTELLLVLVVVLLVFGPKQLPEIARTIGKTLKGVRKAADEFRQESGVDEALRETQRLGIDLKRTVVGQFDPMRPTAGHASKGSSVAGGVAGDAVATGSAGAAAEPQGDTESGGQGGGVEVSGSGIPSSPDAGLVRPEAPRPGAQVAEASLSGSTMKGEEPEA